MANKSPGKQQSTACLTLSRAREPITNKVLPDLRGTTAHRAPKQTNPPNKGTEREREYFHAGEDDWQAAPQAAGSWLSLEKWPSLGGRRFLHAWVGIFT